MKLISLTLKNFLSYGEEEQTIHFDDCGIIAFTGNNGNGKSALLEAITWACWGQARKGQGVSKSDDMIMRIGSQIVTVSLIVQIKNSKYKIIRSAEKKNSRMSSQLELYSLADESIKNISYAHQKETQSLIDSILGINYEMFINTVYVKQGASDEFSRKTPKERKDLLCNILKINEIEETRQKILDDIKKIIEHRQVLIKLEEKLLLNKHSDELININQSKNKIEETIQRLDISVNALRSEFELLNKEKQIIEKEISILKENINIENTEIINLYNQYIAKKILYDQYKHNIQNLNILKNENNTKVQSIESLYSKKNILDKEFEKNIQHIKNTMKITEKKHTDNLNLLKEEEKKLKEEINNLQIENIKNETIIINYIIIEIEESLESQHCTLCKKKINNRERELLLEKKNNYLIQKNQYENTLDSRTNEQNNLTTKYKEKKIAEEKKMTNIIQTLQNEIESKTQTYNQQINEINNIITKSHLLQTLQAKKIIIENTIKNFLNEGHIQACKNIIYTIYDHKNKIKNLNLNLKKIEEELLMINKKSEIKKINLKYEEGCLQKEMIEFAKLESCIGMLNQQLIEQNKELKKIQDEIISEEKTLKIKSNLANILSKNNLQAAIIEESIPIIEQEANLILSKLTHGNSKIYIESMRDLKSGNIKETLDIKIADQVGLRYYEFFSGGEAFRIDLAIRIALIKLLTKKSGNIIKTFIIDEGFGSQDNNNLELIIDMLHILQNEFDLIIIISHLQEMKEQFTTQFFIEKTTSGSIINKI